MGQPLHHNSTFDQLSDAELVRVAQTSAPGDHRAFNVLVARYEAGVATNCRHLSGSEADAPDLKQEVFVKAYFALQRFEARSQFRSWLWRIKINHCLRHLERGKGRTFVQVDTPGIESAEQMRAPASAEDDLERAQDSMRISRALDALADQDRVPLVLRYIDELSIVEVAEQLDIGLSAAKMRLKRAKARFKEAYGISGNAHSGFSEEAEGVTTPELRDQRNP